MQPCSSELPFHIHDWLIISLKDFCIVIRKWPPFLPSIHITENIKSILLSLVPYIYKLLLGYCYHTQYYQYIIIVVRGVPRIWQGGGPRIIFFRFEKPCALLGGFGGMLPRENFLKWCNLVRFGVYFDQILSLKNFKNYHIIYKNFKNCNFIYKRINILDTRNIILVKNFFQKIYD